MAKRKKKYLRLKLKYNQKGEFKIMKQALLTVVLYIARTGMKFIYFFIKLFTKRKNNKITILSRQSDNINIDFRLLKEELNKISRN